MPLLTGSFAWVSRPLIEWNASKDAGTWWDTCFYWESSNPRTWTDSQSFQTNRNLNRLPVNHLYYGTCRPMVTTFTHLWKKKCWLLHKHIKQQLGFKVTSYWEFDEKIDTSLVVCPSSMKLEPWDGWLSLALRLEIGEQLALLCLKVTKYT